ncbi:hypothetical protein BH10CYA1_BH10CYA1_60020 [soil metagenome]
MSPIAKTRWCPTIFDAAVYMLFLALVRSLLRRSGETKRVHETSRTHQSLCHHFSDFQFSGTCLLIYGKAGYRDRSD